MLNALTSYIMYNQELYIPHENDRVRIQGGRILTPHEINRAIRKKFVKPAGSFFNKVGTEVGNFTNKELLPALVSTGIPLASDALGALGTEFGIPPQLTSTLSQSILKGAIPKQYQSNNKYVGLLSNAISAGMSDNPQALANLGSQAMSTVSGDISKSINKGPKSSRNVPPSQQLQSVQPVQPDLQPLQPLDNIQMKPTQTNPQNPYEQQINQLLAMYNMDKVQTDDAPISKPDVNNIEYDNSTLGKNSDSLTITTSPYQQIDGSINGLLGAGLKKRRKRRTKEEILKVELVKPRKFSSNNKALDQLLDAVAEKEELKQKQASYNISKKMEKEFDELKREREFYKGALGLGIKKKSKK